MPAIRRYISTIDIPLPRRVVAGQVCYAPGGGYGPRIQRDVQLVMLDSGSASVSIDGAVEKMQPGQVVCLWPGGRESFAFDPVRETCHRWVALEYDDTPATSDELARLRGRATQRREESPAMRRLFALISAPHFGVTSTAQPPNADDCTTDAMSVHTAMAYLAGYLMPANVMPQASMPPPAIAAMQAMIADRFAEPLTLADLAQGGCVTPSHLVRLCRSTLGITPVRLLWNTRVQQGVSLLFDTGLGIGEIAYRVGFANPFHFSRLVKKKHGKSPRHLRAARWQIPEKRREKLPLSQ